MQYMTLAPACTAPGVDWPAVEQYTITIAGMLGEWIETQVGEQATQRLRFENERAFWAENEKKDNEIAAALAAKYETLLGLVEELAADGVLRAA